MGFGILRFEDDGGTFKMLAVTERLPGQLSADLAARTLTPAEVATLTTMEIVETVVGPFLRRNPDNMVLGANKAALASLGVVVFDMIERSNLTKDDEGKRAVVFQLGMVALMLLAGPHVVLAFNKDDVAEMVNRLCDQIESFAEFHKPGRG